MSSQIKPVDALAQPLPSNYEAERLVLGCSLLDSAQLGEAAAIIRPSDFFIPSHRLMYAAMLALFEKTGTLDPVSLADELRQRGELEAVGGTASISATFDGAPKFSQIAPYARLVKNAATARELIYAGNAIEQSGFDAAAEPETQLANARRLIDAIETARTADAGITADQALVTAMDEIAEFQASQRPFLGLATGLHGLDYLLGGLQRGDLNIIAARPSMGKSAMAMRVVYGMATHEANDNPVIVVFSLEMRPQRLIYRIGCGVGEVNATMLRRSGLVPAAYKTAMGKLDEVAQRLSHCRIFVYGEEAASIYEQAAIVRRLERQHGRVDAVVLDHLQLCKVPGQRADNRNILWDVVTQAHKSIAKRHHCPVVTLSQLSRANEARGDKRPSLGDLRESGAIEQNTDVVMFLHREDYYDKQVPPGEAEVIVAKNRDGQLGTVKVVWRPTYAWFENLHRED